MKVKTSTLRGAALDWAVAYIRTFEATGGKVVLTSDLMRKAVQNGLASYSIDWAQGGPLIEREKIATQFWVSEGEWEALTKGGFFASTGPTLLIAAMRCLVASNLGEEIEIPEELCA